MEFIADDILRYVQVSPQLLNVWSCQDEAVYPLALSLSPSSTHAHFQCSSQFTFCCSRFSYFMWVELYNIWCFNYSAGDNGFKVYVCCSMNQYCIYFHKKNAPLHGYTTFPINPFWLLLYFWLLQLVSHFMKVFIIFISLDSQWNWLVVKGLMFYCLKYCR